MREKWLARGGCVLLCLANAGFLLWEYLDWRSADAAAASAMWLVISCFNTAIVWVATDA